MFPAWALGNGREEPRHGQSARHDVSPQVKACCVVSGPSESESTRARSSGLTEARRPKKCRDGHVVCAQGVGRSEGRTAATFARWCCCVSQRCRTSSSFPSVRRSPNDTTPDLGLRAITSVWADVIGVSPRAAGDNVRVADVIGVSPRAVGDNVREGSQATRRRARTRSSRASRRLSAVRAVDATGREAARRTLRSEMPRQGVRALRGSSAARQA